MTLVRDIKEEGLLKRLHRFCPSEIVGDDAAVISTSIDKKLVVTTDVLVENVHFSDRTTPPATVGWRAAAANLSDIAAMGAKPIGITVGLSLRGDVSVDWVEELYQGLKNCLDKYDTPILGGDVCKSSVISIAITALGEVNPTQVITRNTAKPEDAIVVTGLHGLSKAGLEILLNPRIAINLKHKSKEKLILAHQKPQPRLDVIEAIRKLNFSASIAGMDTSDGLADAIVQVCRCSGVGAEIQENCLKLSEDIVKITSREKALQWTLFGGEDFELLLCLPANFAQILVNQFPSQAIIIGKITQKKEVFLVKNNPGKSKLLLNQQGSFQHF